MNVEILKTVGTVAGIGGLALGVFLILFRRFIEKAIFPRLTQRQAHSLLRTFLVLTFLIALAGIVAWVYAQYLSRASVESRSSSLPPKVIGELVRQPQTESHWPCFPRLDFKVWNPNSTVAFVTSAHLSFKRLALKRQMCAGFGSHYPATAGRCYTVMLDSEKEEQEVVVSVAQVAPSNDIDRFEIVVGVEGDFDFEHRTTAEYEIRGYLEYNDGKRLQVGPEKLSIVREVHTIASETKGPLWVTKRGGAAPTSGGCLDKECAS